MSMGEQDDWPEPEYSDAGADEWMAWAKHKVERLRAENAALYTEVTNSTARWTELAQFHKQRPDELDRLQDENAALREIAQAVANADRNIGLNILIVPASSGEVEHIITRARALLVSQDTP